jgi:hypothetical protein
MAKISNFRRGMMGTIEFDGLCQGMRRPQQFIVYPMHEASEKIVIQSDTRFGAIFANSGEVLLSAPHSSGAYSHTLIADQIRGRAVKDQVSPEDLAALKTAIAGTAGRRVGNSVVQTDNSGAAAMATPSPSTNPTAGERMRESIEQLTARQFVDEMLDGDDAETISSQPAVPDDVLRKWVLNDMQWYGRAREFGGGGDEEMMEKMDEFVDQNREELTAFVLSRTGKRFARESKTRLREQDEGTPAPEGAPNPDADLPEVDDSVVSALLGDFLNGYMEAAFKTSTDNADDSGGQPLDKNYGRQDLAPETLQQMTDDCRAFLKKFGNYVHEEPSRAGVDFWLSRNGHGAGFFDGDWGDDGDRLQSGSKEFGNVDLYIGDDGKLYLM